MAGEMRTQGGFTLAELLSVVAMKKTTCWRTALAVVLLFVVFLSGCGGGKPKVEKITEAEIAAQKKVIQNYYQDIDKKDYEAAYDLTSKNFQRGLSYPNFVYQYKEYVDNVKVKSTEWLEKYSNKTSGVFNVSFDAVYKKKYPVGDGNLPTLHVIAKDGKKWKLDSIGIDTEKLDQSTTPTSLLRLYWANDMTIKVSSTDGKHAEYVVVTGYGSVFSKSEEEE